MSRIASAPHSIASRICLASMTKSFRSSGRLTALRTCRKYSNDPWKNFSSVSTERQLAPAASYSRAMRAGSKSGRITPADGEAFLTSAISANRPAADFRSAPAKSRRSPRARSAACKSSAVSVRCGSRATSRCFSLTMVSRIVIGRRIESDSCLSSFGFRVSFGFRPSDFGSYSSSSLTPCMRLAGQPARSQPFTNVSRSPSITPCTLLVSTPVRRSFTIR